MNFLCKIGFHKWIYSGLKRRWCGKCFKEQKLIESDNDGVFELNCASAWVNIKTYDSK